MAAVEGRVEVYMDGGVRTGNDVLKALALGAKCIFLGRPILWGLTYKVGLLARDSELGLHSCFSATQLPKKTLAREFQITSPSGLCSVPQTSPSLTLPYLLCFLLVST